MPNEFRTLDIEPVRARIEEQRQTPEYQANAARIKSLIDQIRVKVIAVDLEGTLLCTNLEYSLSHNGIYYNDVGARNRFQRPYANELLQAIAESGNRAFIWTGAHEDRAADLIKTSKLMIPSSIPLITREQYRGVLDTLPELADYLGRITVPEGEFNIDESILRRGKVKVPRIMGADILMDDYCHHDIRINTKLFGTQEERKLLLVKPFYFEDEDQLANAHVDTGLVTATEEMHQRLVA